MLKTIAIALSCVVAALLIVPDPVDAQQSGVRAKKERKVARAAQRTSSTGQNGLCLRDSGTPDDKLNFRNRCDVEEFWNRVNERASSGSPF